jgi:hypothetical protein
LESPSTGTSQNLTRALLSMGALEQNMDLVRNAATTAGFDLWFVGDHVFNRPPSSTDQIALLDAITHYAVDDSDTQEGYTFGMEYEGYNTRYLDILQK